MLRTSRLGSAVIQRKRSHNQVEVATHKIWYIKWNGFKTQWQIPWYVSYQVVGSVSPSFEPGQVGLCDSLNQKSVAELCSVTSGAVCLLVSLGTLTLAAFRGSLVTLGPMWRDHRERRCPWSPSFSSPIGISLPSLEPGTWVRKPLRWPQSSHCLSACKHMHYTKLEWPPEPGQHTDS